MDILVINAGSSSLKYQLIDMNTEQYLAKGICERIGIDGKIIHKTHDGKCIEEEEIFKDHKEAFKRVIEVLTDREIGVISSIEEIASIGHRIVQGAERFLKSVIITRDVLKDIEDISDLAPLHNPAHVMGIKACMEIFGDSICQVAVFDTSFHSNMPERAYMFGIPYRYYEKYHIRRYGFHGTSHKYVSTECARLMGKDIKDLKIVTCHLGNGASIAAVDGGVSVDTSMGFTPMDGIIMGTRCGGIDPSIIPFIGAKENIDLKEIDQILNKESGYLGISGIGSDHRELVKAAREGNERARLALEVQYYQIKKYIGAYAATMNGLDAVVFTGGIGENAEDVRSAVCRDMSYFGIEIDEKINKQLRGECGEISTRDSKVKVYIIPTNEELVIARDTKYLVDEESRKR